MITHIKAKYFPGGSSWKFLQVTDLQLGMKYIFFNKEYEKKRDPQDTYIYIYRE